MIQYSAGSSVRPRMAGHITPCGPRVREPVFFKALAVFLFLFLSFPSVAPVSAADLTLDDRQAGKGETVTFTLAVNNAPRTLKAFMLDIVYDFSMLSFSNFTPGELVRDRYSFFNVVNRAPGVLRLGAVEPQHPGIKKGDSGSVVHITFNVIKEGSCALSLTSLANDVEGWTTRDGHFQALPEGSSSSQAKTSDTGESPGGDETGITDPFLGFGSAALPETPKTGEQAQSAPDETGKTGAMAVPETGHEPAGQNGVYHPIQRAAGIPAAGQFSARSGEAGKNMAGNAIPAAPGKQSATGSKSAVVRQLKTAAKAKSQAAGTLAVTYGKTHTTGTAGSPTPDRIIRLAGLLLQVAILALLVLILMKINALHAILNTQIKGTPKSPGNRTEMAKPGKSGQPRKIKEDNK